MVEKIRLYNEALGLHPTVGFAMIIIDLMLGTGELLSGGLGWFVSIGIAIVFTVASALIQKNLHNDNWGAAVGKSLLVGLFTAIPTPIPTLGFVARALTKN